MMLRHANKIFPQSHLSHPLRSTADRRMNLSTIMIVSVAFPPHITRLFCQQPLSRLQDRQFFSDEVGIFYRRLPQV